jgi:hypothetical protein
MSLSLPNHLVAKANARIEHRYFVEGVSIGKNGTVGGTVLHLRPRDVRKSIEALRKRQSSPPEESCRLWKIVKRSGAMHRDGHDLTESHLARPSQKQHAPSQKQDIRDLDPEAGGRP